MSKATVFGVLGGGLLMFMLAVIADCLANPGPRCDECGNTLIITDYSNNEWIEATFYRCERCGHHSFDHHWKKGIDPF